jgi:tetratricopeptide (TPR) repeat protein
MGVWHLKRGEFARSEQHLRRAIAALTKLNANPYDGEAYYNLGLALRFQGRDDEAYAAFYKATWNAAWRSPAFYALAEFDCRRGQWQTALEHLRQCLRVNVDHNNARNLAAIVLRRLGRITEAADLLRETLAFDPLDAWARHLSGRPVGGNNQLLLDIAFDCARAGLPLGALAGADLTARDGSVPILLYLQGRYAEAAQAPPDYCFPSRLEELLVLQQAPPGDACAQYYLGNLLYDRRRYHEAIACWQRSVELDPAFSIAWRNLGIGCFNVLGKPADARQAFDRAFLANPNDARLLYERDQLWKRIGELPARRLAELEQHPHLVQRRDDLSVELAALYNQTGQPEKALAVIGHRPFQPWEGGEGLALGQHVRTHLKLGRGALARGENEKAHQLFVTALTCPENLGEARHAVDYPTEIYYWLGDFESAAQGNGYYAALALERLGRHPEAQAILKDLLYCARRQAGRTVQVDYFATSLPAMLLFNDDLQKRNTIEAMFLEAQALLGLGQDEEGRRLLQRVLELDQNHAGAADVL